MTTIEAGVREHVTDTLNDLAILKSWGYTGSHAERLAMLVLLGGEALTMSDLGERIDLSRAAVTTLVDRLESSKVAKRDNDPADRRRTAVKILPSASVHFRSILTLGLRQEIDDDAA